MRLIDEAVGRIKEHMRERTILHDLFFRERLEYPTFAWQEALVNAVAHRDYALTGASDRSLDVRRSHHVCAAPACRRRR